MTAAPSRLIQMLQDVVRTFDRSNIAHAIVGGMAVAAHGLPRATKDIDFLIDHADSQRADAALRALGFERESAAGGDGFARYVRHPSPEIPEITEWVDLLLARHDIGRTLLRDAAVDSVTWQGMNLPVVSPAGVVLMKLHASVDDPTRLQDRADIIGLLQLHRDTIDELWIQHHAEQMGVAYADAYRTLAAEADTREHPSRPQLKL